MTSLTISACIFLIGLSLWMLNKFLKCSSWHLGYFLVLVQGAGLGLLIEGILEIVL